MIMRLEAFRSMALLRVAEEELAKLYLREKIMSFVHFYVGQEAVAVGVSNSLELSDRALGNHRSHGHYLAKGGSLRAMICELLGKVEGCARGKGGSMHMIDKAKGFTGTTPILGSIASIAAGSAFAQKRERTGAITVAYIGDGAFEEGGVYETLNLATLFNLPLLIVIENNLYSVNSKLKDRRSKNYNAGTIVQGFGLRYLRADGNDYDDVRSKATELVAGVRRGFPAVLECIAYRHMAHSSPLFDDAQGYREDDIPEKRAAEDCLTKLRDRLVSEGIADEVFIGVFEEARTRVSSEIAYALAAPYPDADELYMDLYA